MATFGGYHAKAESDLLQKKLKEEAAKDDDITESLVKSAAGMNIHDEDYSSDDDKYRDPDYQAPAEEDDSADEWKLTYAAGVEVRVRVRVRERCACAWAVGERCARDVCASDVRVHGRWVSAMCVRAMCARLGFRV
jgi:hypothetical protein